MIRTIRNVIVGKRVLILGFGREGRSSLRMILKTGGYKSLIIADLREIQFPQMVELLQWNVAEGETDAEKTHSAIALLEQIEIVSGEDYQKALYDCDVVFKSPGIVPEKPVSEYSCRFVSQTELFFQRYRQQIVGVTGTKGKSTAATLLYHALKENGLDVVLAGNIGIPVFDITDEIGEETTIVVELSCHQLEYMTVAPHIAVLMNLFEEHLDHYGTMDKYVAAKQNIYTNQVEGDILYCGADILPGHEIKGAGWACKNAICRGKVVSVAMAPEKGDIFLAGNRIHCVSGKEFLIPENGISLMGQHNYFDIALVYGVCQEFGISDEGFQAALRTYSTLPHRLQYIGTVGGVKYYDDSISTIGETTIQALESITDTDTVLIGGLDRGVDYDELEEYLSASSVRHIILMAETGKRIYKEIKLDSPGFEGKERLVLVENLRQAVDYAKKVTAPGKSCVLSPAAASYGIFKNFEERGEKFCGLVLG